jgi:hypothetical protein
MISLYASEVFVIGVLVIQFSCLIWINTDFHLYLYGLPSSSKLLVSNHDFWKYILLPSSSGEDKKRLLFCWVLEHGYSEARYSSYIWRSNEIINSAPSPSLKTEYANVACLKTNLPQGRS